MIEASDAGRQGRLSGAAPKDRLSMEEAVRLWEETDVFTLGRMAHEKRLAMHPESAVTYIVDRNINYTNICACGCLFCAFFRAPGREGGYVLSFEELGRKVQETIGLGGYQILLQGGMHPEIGRASCRERV